MPRPETSHRIVALDVVRGFALCGILLANVQPIASVGHTATTQALQAQETWLGLLVDQRIFPIFALLFGVGFALLLRSAGDRTSRPRLVLLRRLLVLLAVGLAHHFLLWPGDILTVYALVGLVVLLPSSWLPRWVVAVLAAVLVVAAAVFTPGFFTLVPGLFLLGAALTRYGVVDRLGASLGAPALVGLAFAVAAAPALWLQVRGADGPWLGVSGLLLAGTYVCALLVLLRTPLAAALRAVFAPLGRMALTNYLTATVLVRLVAGVAGLLTDIPPHRWSTATVVLVAAAILAVQWVWSTCWLRRFRYGPLEWLWRWATWLQRPALLRAAPVVTPRGSSSRA